MVVRRSAPINKCWRILTHLLPSSIAFGILAGISMPAAFGTSCDRAYTAADNKVTIRNESHLPIAAIAMWQTGTDDEAHRSSLKIYDSLFEADPLGLWKPGEERTFRVAAPSVTCAVVYSNGVSDGDPLISPLLLRSRRATALITGDLIQYLANRSFESQADFDEKLAAYQKEHELPLLFVTKRQFGGTPLGDTRADGISNMLEIQAMSLVSRRIRQKEQQLLTNAPALPVSEMRDQVVKDLEDLKAALQ